MKTITSEVGETLLIGDNIQLTILETNRSFARFRVEGTDNVGFQEKIVSAEESKTSDPSVMPPLISGNWLGT